VRVTVEVDLYPIHMELGWAGAGPGRPSFRSEA
jgi:hypothetical protein